MLADVESFTTKEVVAREVLSAPPVSIATLQELPEMARVACKAFNIANPCRRMMMPYSSMGTRVALNFALSTTIGTASASCFFV
jgi:hypothetical protein